MKGKDISYHVKGIPQPVYIGICKFSFRKIQNKHFLFQKNSKQIMQITKKLVEILKNIINKI
jgi:hypothetical protein